jgi:glucose-6-phosphate 1-epimerase
MSRSGQISDIDFNGLPALELCAADGARAVVSLFGAQVLSWRPAGGREWLYLSERALLDRSGPIRGGVPVCFPQFADLGDLPKHGLVRQRDWAVLDRQTADDFVLARLGLTPSAEDLAFWPQEYSAGLTVALAENRIDLELEIANTGRSLFSFTAALHTYLRVSEVEEVTLEGLYGHDYRDKTDHDRVKRETGVSLSVDDEVDRVYRNVSGALLLRDSGRSLAIHGENFPDVVVWNPWLEKCAALADMPPDGFRRMLCVEAAAADTRVELAPGAEWWARQTLVAL